jgi:hypothetical protein
MSDPATLTDREQIEKVFREQKVIPLGAKVAWSPYPSTNPGNRISTIHICDDNKAESTLHLGAYLFERDSGNIKVFMGRCSRCRLVILKEQKL